MAKTKGTNEPKTFALRAICRTAFRSLATFLLWQEARLESPQRSRSREEGVRGRVCSARAPQARVSLPFSGVSSPTSVKD